jgi:predicted transcriptional regulator
MIKRATWYIDEDLLYKLKRIALDDRTTLTAIANQAFTDYVNKRQPITNQPVSASTSEKDVKTFSKDLHTRIEKDRKRRK